MTSKDIYARRTLVIALQAPHLFNVSFGRFSFKGATQKKVSQMIKANTAAAPTAPESNAVSKTAVATDGTSSKAAPSFTVVQLPVDEARQGLMNDIAQKWSRFSKEELGGLKNKDDLIAQIVIKYGIDKPLALREVDGVFKGRSF